MVYSIAGNYGNSFFKPAQTPSPPPIVPSENPTGSVGPFGNPPATSSSSFSGYKDAASLNNAVETDAYYLGGLKESGATKRGDGAINKAELLKAYQNLGSDRPEKAYYKDLYQNFKSYDTNHDGKLDQKEEQAALEAYQTNGTFAPKADKPGATPNPS